MVPNNDLASEDKCHCKECGPTLVEIEEFTNNARLENLWARQSKAGLIGALLSVGYMLIFRGGYWEKLMWAGWDSGIATALLCLWAVGPATWFAYETGYLITRGDKQNKTKRIAEFKMGQDAAKAFWIAVATLIALLWQKKG